jgi:hypothetical protein
MERSKGGREKRLIITEIAIFRGFLDKKGLGNDFSI